MRRRWQHKHIFKQTTAAGGRARTKKDRASVRSFLLVEIEGLKPSTSALPALRSNQLSYIPIVASFMIPAIVASSSSRCFSRSTASLAIL